MNDEFQHITSLPSIDADYRFGLPKLYLAAHELARLTLLRSNGNVAHSRSVRPVRLSSRAVREHHRSPRSFFPRSPSLIADSHRIALRPDPERSWRVWRQRWFLSGLA